MALWCCVRGGVCMYARCEQKKGRHALALCLPSPPHNSLSLTPTNYTTPTTHTAIVAATLPPPPPATPVVVAVQQDEAAVRKEIQAEVARQLRAYGPAGACADCGVLFHSEMMGLLALVYSIRSAFLLFEATPIHLRPSNHNNNQPLTPITITH